MNDRDLSSDIQHQNSHVQRLRKRLRKLPSGCERATLHLVGDPPLVLGTWAASELTEAHAEVIFELMQEAFLQGESDCSFLLTFEGGDPVRTLATDRFGFRHRALPVDVDQAGSLARALDGSDKASNMLAQSSVLALARMFVAGQQASQTALVRALDITSERALQAEERAAQYRQERDELIDHLQQRQGERDSDEPPRDAPMTEAQKRVVELAERALTLAMIKWGSGGASGSGGSGA